MRDKKFEDSKRFFIDGLKQLQNKNYIKAIEYFNLSLAIIPDRFSTMKNLAIALIELKNFSEAEKLVNKIINLFPEKEDALLLHGKILTEAKKIDEAIKLYNSIIAINPNCYEAHNALGYIFKEKKLNLDSLQHFKKSLNIKDDQNFTYGDYLELKLRLSDWNDFSFDINNLKFKTDQNENTISPFVLINLIDDPNLHFRVAKAYNRFIYPSNKRIDRENKRNNNKKIKIAYYSSDFRNHPVFRLIIGMLENHNKNIFEVFLFSFLPTSDESISKRILNTKHKFINASLMGNDEIVRLSRLLEIDIAIDLNGHTQNARSEIFEMICAPIQINYLGYPGTSGSENIDYIVADKILIDKKNEHNFTEKIIYLPNSYQVNDRNKFSAFAKLNKKDLGLPENHFVFCCFNNNVKINPDMFDNWMFILKNVNESVLWLLGNENDDFCVNLKKEALKRGVSPDRLIFAPRASNDFHLSRFVHADLFLDTYPYNAHTTASDALWAGVPVLTFSGRSFPSRVAASLLNSIGLSELITYSVEEYIDKSIEIAMNKNKLLTLKQKLKLNKFNFPLFDTAKFTKGMESAYKIIYDRFQLGLQPENIEIQ